MTGKVIWHTTMSLDGYIADSGDSLDWAFGHGGSIVPSLVEIVESTGAVLIGRRLHDLGATTVNEAKLYGGAYTGPVLVLTHRPPTAPGEETVRFVSSGVHDAIAQARAAAGGKNVIVIGAGVASQCLAEGLVDELLIHQVPVLLGAGVRMIANPGGLPVKLETAAATRSGQITNLRFQVKRSAG
jgi:dihydrofolate reductase